MSQKKTPAQIQREIDQVIRTGTPLRRVIATRAQALRVERAKEAAASGLIALGDDEGELYDIEIELAKIARRTGVDPRLVATTSASTRARRRIKSTSYLALAAVGIGAAIGIAGARKSK